MNSEAASPDSRDEPEAPAAPKRKWLRPVLAVAGYTAIIALAWRAIDHDKLFEGLRRLKAIHVAAILVISLLHIDGRAYRFHRLLLRNNPTGYRWTDGFAIFLIGLSTSAVTPARAGDFVKAQLVKKHGVSFSAGFGLVLIERMLDLLVLTTAIIVAGLSLSSNAAAIWNRAAVFLLLCLVAGLAVLTSKKLRDRFIGLGTAVLRKISPAKADAVSSKVDSIFETWDAIFKSPVTLLSYFLGSGLIWSIEFAKLWCVLMFLGEPASLPAVFFVYPVSILAGVLTLLPFSEGVVGVTGVALLAALGGVDPAVATIAVVIDRGASSLPPIVLAMTSGLWRRDSGR
jgi:uncharacterized protein (TIRG00374 family)